MTIIGILQGLILFAAIFALTKPLGAYLARVFSRERTILDPVLTPIERFIYRFCRVNAAEEMPWQRYTVSLIFFSLIGSLLLYGIMRFQHFLPWNPMGFPAMAPDLSFNTSTSFVTGSSWQAYPGESTMSYFTDMAGIAVQDFLSAAAGLAVAIAIIRGFVGSRVEHIGNFWVDIVRSCLYILVPISVVGSLLFVGLGVIQNLSPYVTATTLEGVRQILPMGPVASEEIIKLLSASDGGGFFNANSAHPFENPSALVNFLQMFCLFIIPAGITYCFGRMVKDQKQGWVLFGVMSVLFFAGFLGMYATEQQGDHILKSHNIVQQSATTQTGGNMEGKEVRFGIANSTLYETVTTDVSDGATNASLDSFTPLGGMVALVNMMLGEIIFGGVGSGLYGMLLLVVITVFIAGLMIGRTPEYLGKKIQSREMKLAMVALLPTTFCILGFAAYSAVSPEVLKSLGNKGTHGLTELIYAFTSTATNNGSAMAGLQVNTPFWNITTGIAMLVGRFTTMIAMLAMAGSLAAKPTAPPSKFTFQTNNLLFGGLLIAVIFIIGGLTYFPALAIGPILEHLQMIGGKVF
jgi:potassium-transporting ATPase potassium-binding subunit